MSNTKVMHLEDGQIRSDEIDPNEYGIRMADFNELAGGDAAQNAAIVRDILSGEETGAKKDIVLLNAAAAIIVSGIANDFVEGIEKADLSISSGKASECLQKLIQISNHEPKE
jgi:anthranilate phosphoribosyltransferase